MGSDLEQALEVGVISDATEKPAGLGDDANDEKKPSTNPTQSEQVDSDQEQPRKGKPLSFYLSFLALLVMVFVISIDATILGVAIPVIASDLGGTTLEAFWASMSFALAVVVTQPIHTSVSDVFGRMVPLYASIFLFVLGSIIFATAKNMGVLIVGRVFQGLGGGGVDVLTEIIIADITTLKERPLYLGVLALPMAGGTILGPVLGGIFTQYSDWTWIGWINLPISAVGFLLFFFFLRLRSIDEPFTVKVRKLDWIGLSLFAVGCTLFSTPLAWAGAMYSWSSWETLVPFLIGIIILSVFCWYESKPALPAFPYRIFSNRTACATLAAAFIHGALTYSAVFYMPLFFQAVYLETPIKSAISIIPLCASSIGFGIVAAVAVETFRKYKILVLISYLLMAIGAGICTLWDDSSSLAKKVIFQIILGMGSGSLFTVLNLPIQASMANVDDIGLATGVLVSFRLFGGLVGLAICSSVFNSVFQQKISKLDLPDALAGLRDVHEAVAFIPQLRDIDAGTAELQQVIDGYKKSIFALFWMMAGASSVGFIISFLIKELSLEREEVGQQQFEDKKRE